MAGKALRELTKNRPELLIEERELLLRPFQALHDGITMIPALKVGDQKLSGIYLSKDCIARFLQETGCL
jgi:hypothetical protein